MFFNHEVDTGQLNDAPIMTIFVDQNNNPVSAESTNSQNLSKFSTSSLPYNDAGPTAVDREGSGDNVVVIDTEGGAGDRTTGTCEHNDRYGSSNGCDA